MLDFYVSENAVGCEPPWNCEESVLASRYFWSRMIYCSEESTFGNKYSLYQRLGFATGGLIHESNLIKLLVKRRL